MSLNLAPQMLVREAMSSPVISILEDRDVTEAAKLMRDHSLGAIVVNSPDDQPVGIITERDIVIRVAAEGKSPVGIKIHDVMSSPLRVVKAETKIVDAMRVMDKLNIRRLGITYKDQLVGIISHKDIIRIIPTIIEIMQETEKIGSPINGMTASIVGYCDRCEIYSSHLLSIEGEYLCEDCRAEENIV